MKFRGLFAAAAILLILAGVLYWSGHHKPSENAAAASSETPNIVKVDTNAVTGLTLKRKGEAPITLDKASDGKWQITAPVPAAADSEAVSGMLSSLTPLTSQRVVEDKATSLSQFGLTDPALQLDITTKNNKTAQLDLGDSTPTGDAVYAAVAGDPRVFTAAAYVKTSLDKSEDDLRDKRLLPVEASSVSGIEVEHNGKDIDFGRVQNGWQIEKPQPYRTDSYEVTDLLQQLVGTKWQPSQNGPDPAKAFVQGTPFATVKLTGSSGTDTLEVRKDKDNYYAKSSAVPGVYQMDSALGTTLDRGLDEYRNKQLFDFGYADPQKIEYHSGSTSLVLTRTGNDWWSNGKKMDAGSAEALVSGLRDLAASKFVDSGFTSPNIEVAVTTSDGKKVERASLQQTKDGAIAKRDDGPSLYFLDPATLSTLTSAASGVKAAAAAPAKK